MALLGGARQFANVDAVVGREVAKTNAHHSSPLIQPLSRPGRAGAPPGRSNCGVRRCRARDDIGINSLARAVEQREGGTARPCMPLMERGKLCLPPID